MNNKGYCCEGFKESATSKISSSPLAMVYGSKGSQIEKHEGIWYVNGCCGGGCSVLGGIEFCPFCGSKLP